MLLSCQCEGRAQGFGWLQRLRECIPAISVASLRQRWASLHRAVLKGTG